MASNHFPKGFSRPIWACFVAKVLRAYPEEHDGGDKGAQWDGVDADGVHPGADGIAVFDEHAYGKRGNGDDADPLPSAAGALLAARPRWAARTGSPSW